MINIVYKNYNFGSIFKLSPGLYFTNNLLGDYDCFEGFGRCDNKCVFCCDSDSSQYSNDLSIKLSSLSNGKILLC